MHCLGGMHGPVGVLGYVVVKVFHRRGFYGVVSVQ
jgi:hypothetical protein